MHEEDLKFAKSIIEKSIAANDISTIQGAAVALTQSLESLAQAGIYVTDDTLNKAAGRQLLLRGVSHDGLFVYG